MGGFYQAEEVSSMALVPRPRSAGSRSKTSAIWLELYLGYIGRRANGLASACLEWGWPSR